MMSEVSAEILSFFGVSCPYQGEHRNHPRSLLGFLSQSSGMMWWLNQQKLSFISSPAHLQGQNEQSPLKQKAKHIQGYSSDKTQINTDMLKT